MNVAEFAPVPALLGGALIGLAAAGLWWLLGRIAGVSNVLGGAVLLREPRGGWRWAFLAGLLVSGAGAAVALPWAVQFQLDAGYAQLVLAGVLVGFGTQLGSGCTSGHGVCGVSRLSPRSLVATGVFMATGVAAVYLTRHLLA
ncbi:MAG TPA: YeeE/YedE family protein [Burkholderiales bacterium]|jgi:uncharacterized membrane protein YedE/YeeE|nr:YeeE/YedE family protein [Burkholderiales bacterium]